MNADLQALLEELETFGIANDDREQNRRRRMLNITADTGRFLHILVQSTGAGRILEVGTSNGYSTIWLADAARAIDGHVTSLDVDAEKTRMAAANLKRAGLSDRVTLHTGEAASLIEALAGPFDLVFLDADRPTYLRYLELVLPRLRAGGLLVADNVVSHAAELQEYLRAVRHHPDLETVTLPVGKGEELTYKRA
jgi:predicted O-methyltransferase YrrM